MTEPVPLWTRPYLQTPGQAHVAFACLSPRPLTETTQLDAARFGMPHAAAAAQVEIRGQARAGAPDFFAQWSQGEARAMAEAQLGPQVARLDASQYVFLVRSEEAEALDLGYLQAAWAVARWLVSRGADVVIDLRAGRFWSGEDVASVAPQAPLDVRRELSLVMEPQPLAPDDEHWFFTRGMSKAGRPDLVCAATPDDRGMLAQVFLGLADWMFKGALPPDSKMDIRVGDDDPLQLVPADVEVARRLGLRDDTLCLVDGDGGSLGGVAAYARKFAAAAASS